MIGIDRAPTAAVSVGNAGVDKVRQINLALVGSARRPEKNDLIRTALLILRELPHRPDTTFDAGFGRTG